MKSFNLNGIAGLVCSRKNRITKTMISLYSSEQSGLESDPEYPWVTVCEDHSYLVCHQKKADAVSAITMPDWCSECSNLINI